MLGIFTKTLALGSLIVVSTACSQAEAPKSQKVAIKSTQLRDRVTSNTPARTPANAELSCEQIWAGFVAANPVGYSKTYQSTTTTAYTGVDGLPTDTVIETSKDTVTASSDEAITITYVFTTSADPAPIPEQVQTLNKADFLAQCNAPIAALPEAPVGQTPAVEAFAPTVEILEEGTERLTVAAGEFDTDFVKGKITQTGENAYIAFASEWYITGTDFLVKSTFETSSTFDAITITTTQIVELIELVTPAVANTPAA